MRLEHPLLMRIGGLGIATFTRAWMSTLDFQIAACDPRVDPAHAGFRGPAIFIFWHEYIPFLFHMRGHCNIAMLLSRHRDAEWLSRATRHMGFKTVRGSTSRGGSAALRQLLRVSDEMNLTITPDGPRGPRRRLAAGPIYLSSRLQIPLVAAGLGYDRPWRFNTWDRFALPRPFSRARAVTGPFIQIPPKLDRSEVEHYRQRVERLVTRLTEDAESWAETGTRRTGQTAMHRQGRPPAVFREEAEDSTNTSPASETNGRRLGPIPRRRAG